LGGREVSAFPVGIGTESKLGLIVAGSQRVGFPEQTESLVLSVAANQLASGLQQALLLSKQKQVAGELDRRVAERMRELDGIDCARGQSADRRDRHQRQHLPAHTIRRSSQNRHCSRGRAAHDPGWQPGLRSDREITRSVQ
jgi:hypothetical protein